MKRLVLFSTIFTCLFSVTVFAQSNTFPTTGNVGIGTTSPLANLDIVSGRSTLRVAGNSGADSWRARILLDRGDNYRGAGLWIQASVESELDWYAGVPYTGAGFSIGYHGTQPEYRANSKLFIKPDGNIGIGTDAPDMKLSIHSSDSTISRVHYTGSSLISGLRIGRAGSYGDIVNTQNGFGIGAGTNSGNLPLSNQDTNYIGFFISNIANNVGIGTTSPTNKLEVNGKIRSKEVIVEATGWPDYVFETDYDLPTLAEIEAYINTHKHLPEIPSAKEIEENGLTLGEMNALLLKKIEELTLHIIEQEKRIKKLESQN